MMFWAKMQTAAIITIAAVAVGGATTPVVMEAVAGEPQAKQGSITGDIELLPVIAKGFKDNLDKIKTWKGKATVHTSKDNLVTAEGSDPAKPTTIKDGIRDVTESAEFIIDVGADNLRWSREIIEGTIQNEQGVRMLKLTITAGLSTDLDSYINPYLPDQREKAPRHIVSHPKGTIQQSRAMDAFNPFYIMKNDLDEDKVISEQLVHYYNWQNNNILKSTTGFIKKEGEIVTFETDFIKETDGKTVKIYNKKVFDLSKGCNPIELIHTWQGGTYRWQVEYEEVAGVFVPNAIIFDYSYSPPNQEFQGHLDITIITEMLNEVISPDEFTFEKIGVRPGDYVTENIPGGRNHKWGEEPEANPGLSKEEMIALVEDFFTKNFRDVTAKETIEWGEVTVDENGNSSIRYKYHANIWNRDKMIMNQVFTFAPDGKYLSYKNLDGFPQREYSITESEKAELPPDKIAMMKLVEDFFRNNFKDVTWRETIEWGEVETDDNGNSSIRYKYNAIIHNRDHMVMNQIFTFDQDGKYVSYQNIEGFPEKIGLPTEAYQPEFIPDQDVLMEKVEALFQGGFRDITDRETIEWGEVEVDSEGNSSIRYMAEVTIWDREIMIMNTIFTFDKNGKFVSFKNVEGYPKKQETGVKAGKEDNTAEVF